MASLIDYIVIGIFLSLYLNKKYTFKINDKLKFYVLLKAVVSNILIFIVNISILYIFITYFKINPYLAQGIALIIIAACSYLFYEFFIFKGQK